MDFVEKNNFQDNDKTKLILHETVFDEITDNIVDMITHIDEEGIVLYINRAVEIFFGVNKRDVLGKLFLDFFNKDKDLYERIKFSFFGGLKGRHESPFEMSLKNCKGEQRLLEARVKPVINNENIVGFVSIIQDVTELKSMQFNLKRSKENLEIEVKKRTQELEEMNMELQHEISQHKITHERLLESTEIYTNLVENAKDGVLLVTNGKITFANKAMENLSGYSLNEIKNLSYLDLTAPEKREYVLSLFRKSIEGGEIPKTIDSVLLCKDNSKRHIESTSSRLSNVYNGSLSVSVVIVRDVTEKIAMQERMKAAKERFEGIIESTNEFIISVDNEGIINAWNSSVANFTGISREKILGTSVYENSKDLKFSSLSALFVCIRDILETDGPCNAKFKLESKEGVSKDIYFTSSNVNNGDGVVIIGRKNDVYISSGSLTKGLVFMVYGDNGLSGAIASLDNFSKKILVTRASDSSSYDVSFIYADIFKDIKALEKLYGLLKEISSKENNFVMVVDRIDYLVTTFGFSKVLSFLYDTADLFAGSDNALVINLNKDLFEKKELLMLEEEFKIIEISKEVDVYLDSKDMNILKFISSKNSEFSNIKYSHISREFNVSRATTKKIIVSLKEKGLITTKKDGRNKYVYITDKGKELFS